MRKLSFADAQENVVIPIRRSAKRDLAVAIDVLLFPARTACNGEPSRPYPHDGASGVSTAGRGAKSRGPVTPEGKLNSAASRIASGSLAKTILLEGESAGRFNALLASLMAELNPQTEIETTLVESPAGRTTRAWQSLAEQSPWLDRMRLHEARYARQYFRALREFRDYRAARIAAEKLSEGIGPDN